MQEVRIQEVRMREVKMREVRMREVRMWEVRMQEKGERTDCLLSSNGCVPYALTQLQTPKKRLTYHFIPFKLLGSEHFDYVTHRG